MLIDRLRQRPQFVQVDALNPVYICLFSDCLVYITAIVVTLRVFDGLIVDNPPDRCFELYEAKLQNESDTEHHMHELTSVRTKPSLFSNVLSRSNIFPLGESVSSCVRPDSYPKDSMAMQNACT